MSEKSILQNWQHFRKVTGDKISRNEAITGYFCKKCDEPYSYREFEESDVCREPGCKGIIAWKKVQY
jgi:hypothetical protein